VRLVLDSNVIVSVFLFQSGPRIIEAIERKELIPILSPSTLAEYIEVLVRPKFSLAEEDIEDIVRFIRWHGEFVESVPEIHPVCSDPDDDKFLALAAATKTDAIVSGDSDLLHLKEYRGIPIIRLVELLERLPIT
jgi:putative PIN family toxin of toxin-antitoxin system